MTSEVLQWYDHYWHCKENLCALEPYGTEQAKWYEATMFYNTIINQMQRENVKSKHSEKQAENEVKDAIARFQNGK